MKIIRDYFYSYALIIVSSFTMGFESFAATGSSKDFASIPPFVAETSDPLVMFAMSNDHQLWVKAYTDYSDLNKLDDDYQLDTTYNDSFEYYGYFNSNFCYDYWSSLGHFKPNGRVIVGSHKCNRKWSGNFLNWLTMTRIDIVRKVLYGGYRAVDSQYSTILQRALIPSDAHAFVKVARSTRENPLSSFTPFNNEEVLSFCNVTDYQTGSSVTGKMDVSSNPPLLKVAVGDFSTWSGSEQVQCQYSDSGENGDPKFSPTRPSGTLLSTEYKVRVEVCKANQDQSECREYKNERTGRLTYKPSGLMQLHGEDQGMSFGLITGSYEKNLHGGVLRKNITTFAGGAESSNEVDLNTGIFINQDADDDGIINTLNRLRIQGWNYQKQEIDDKGTSKTSDDEVKTVAKYDDCATYNISISEVKGGTQSDKRCRDWGNPIGEIYLEALRYFSGKTTPTEKFDADDSSRISGLDAVTWVDPMPADKSCSNCSIIVLSTGLNSFDGDDLSSASDVPKLGGTGDSVSSKTNSVGQLEGINNGSYIVGKVDASTTPAVCNSKTVANLGSVNGLCPEIPQKEGTYNIAGLAYHAKTNDLRGGTDYPDDQNVTTYAIALAESLPSFEIQSSDQNGSISFVPSCRSRKPVPPAPSECGGKDANGLRYCCQKDSDPDGDSYGWEFGASCRVSSAPDKDLDSVDGLKIGDGIWNDCSLVDVTVVTQTPKYGRLLISWEDSHWGNDYDMDGYSSIEYCTATGSAEDVRKACPSYTDDAYAKTPKPEWESGAAHQVQIRTSVPAAAAGFDLKFGFIMNGATSGNGAKIDVLRRGDKNYNSKELTGSDTGVVRWSKLHKFATSAGSPNLLESPLWYAAKYGGFNDINGNNKPDLTEEWDVSNVNGESGSDGIPDTFFPVSNPGNLEKQLNSILSKISIKLAAGGAVALSKATAGGSGSVFQALYKPQFESGGKKIEWGGIIQGLFIDEYNNYREDSDNNGKLTNADKVIIFEPDVVKKKTIVKRYITANGGKTYTPAPPAASSPSSSSSASGGPMEPETVDVDQLDTLWNARDQLAKMSPADRKIYTSIGSSTTLIPFNTDNFGAPKASSDGISPPSKTHFRYLGLDSATQGEADKIVDYIRGTDIPGYRSRTVDFMGDSKAEVWRLGDIVNSSPVAVGSPNGFYDLLYGDDDYKDYIDDAKIKNRRTVVYAGANDGMIHAFNSGFALDPKTEGIGFKTGGGSSQPELGSELWAYIPQAVLPHLRWLTEPNYPHVYYVDGIPQVFDAKIFSTTDPAHPKGWGTILVVGLGFGGGDITFDPDSDTDTDTSDDITLRSSYVVLDITDPESPSLIAEISHPNMGYATTRPALLKSLKDGGRGEWYLVIGSGPYGSDASAKSDALSRGVSDQNAKLFVYDLVNKEFKSPGSGQDAFTVPGAVKGMTGDLTAVDWDGDARDDAVYFGTVLGTPKNSSGQLMRFVPGGSGNRFSFSDATINKVIDGLGQPINGKPHVTTSADDKDYWIHFGTGRFYVAEDNKSTSLHGYVGVKESKDLSTPISWADLEDTTGIEVYTNKSVKRNGAPVNFGGGENISNHEELKAHMRKPTTHGWYFSFGAPGRRQVGKSDQSDVNIFFTDYTPSGQNCNPIGQSALSGVHYETGTSPTFTPFTIDGGTSPTTNPDSDAVEVIQNRAEFSPGLVRDVDIDSLPVRFGGAKDPKENFSPAKSGRASWKEF